ncbi:MAG TPA: hypothetical protein VM658_16685 [bacterium]|nr:hypothetical protein [bacterium]
MAATRKKTGLLGRNREKIKAGWPSEQWRKQGERFGLGVALAMAVMSALALYRGLMERMETTALIGAALLCLALILPRALYPAAWLLETAFKTVTKTTMYLLLVAVFYLVFSPIGIILRIMGKDILHQNLDPSAPSYWTPRKPTDPKRAEKQF